MANNLTILNFTGASTVIGMVGLTSGVNSGVLYGQSIPTNSSGTALLGQFASATSIPVVIASDQSTLTTVIAAGVAAIGTVSALQSGAWTTALGAGTQAVGTVTALQGGNWVIAAGANAIGTVSALQSGAWTTALGAGTQAVGTVTALQGGNWVIAAGANAIGTVSSLQSGAWTVAVSNSLSVTANTTTPLSVVASSATVAGVAIKATSGTLVSLNMYCNNTTYPVFLKVFNLSASVVTAGGISGGAAVPTFIMGIPPGDARDVDLPLGTNFTTAMSYAITKFALASDTTTVTTADLVGMITYF